jgi:hypothetical protein
MILNYITDVLFEFYLLQRNIIITFRTFQVSA